MGWYALVQGSADECRLAQISVNQFTNQKLGLETSQGPEIAHENTARKVLDTDGFGQDNCPHKSCL